jgi:hypothetical protein
VRPQRPCRRVAAEAVDRSFPGRQEVVGAAGLSSPVHPVGVGAAGPSFRGHPVGPAELPIRIFRRVVGVVAGRSCRGRQVVVAAAGPSSRGCSCCRLSSHVLLATCQPSGFGERDENPLPSLQRSEAVAELRFQAFGTGRGRSFRAEAEARSEVQAVDHRPG